MNAFSTTELREATPADAVHYHEFLRQPALSLGFYTLPARAVDPQQPHREDEVYVVMAGKATFHAGNGSRPIAAGDILYVPAGQPHRFSDIAEALALIVLFAPAESK